MNKNYMGRAQGPRYQHSQPGPLLTDHLQVRNLDRELEMLRYKRETIQREQQMLGMTREMDRKRQYEYTNRIMPNQYGNVWQPSPPKRTNTPQQGKQWNAPQDHFDQKMSKRIPDNYIPSLFSKKIESPGIPVSLKPIVHPILKNTVAQRFLKPTNVRKDFRPTQVLKKKPRDPPNKLESYPIKERMALVSKATESLSAKNKTNKPPEHILREDQIPSKQVNGRLELALGSIVKEIRCSNDHSDTFKTIITNALRQRTLKRTIRERIRSVMLNKPVGSVADIVNKYREKFPKRTDKDLVDLVLNSESPKLETVIDTESPEEFFNKNISSILEKKVKQMSSNLLNLYSKVGRKVGNVRNMILDESVETDSDLNNENAMKILRGITGKYVTSEERIVLTKFYTNLIEDILEKKLPEYLSQCTDHFLKIFDMDRQIKYIKLMTSKKIQGEVEENMALQDQNEPDTETSDKNVIHNNEMSDNKQVEEAFTEKSDLEGNAVTENKEMTEIKESKEHAVNENNDTEEDKHTESVPAKEITADAVKNEDIMQANPVLVVASELSTKSTPIPNTTESSPILQALVSQSPALAKELPYYIKLIGRPTLPNRAAICDFLNNYRPSSIKKHKTISNLLVVGFNNQEDYNKIISANETLIGDITIIIKASEKVIPGKENVSIKEGNAEKKETQKEIHENVNNSKNENEKDIIGKELDDQITDLLSSVKETDREVMECKNEENSNGNEAQSIETGNGLSQESNNAGKCPLEPIKEAEVEQSNEAMELIDKSDKMSNVKESGKATPIRSSSRLANVTPSTIRTRRASRLMQE